MKKSVYTFFALLFFCTVRAQIPTSGLVARYGFDGSGNDLSGNNRNVTTNNVTYVTDRNGTPNSAIKFSGSTGSYAEITGANVASFQNNQYSFGGWVRVDAMTTNSFGTVFQVAGGSAEQIVGPVNTTTPQSFAAWTYSIPATNPACLASVNANKGGFTFTKGAWYHVFVTNSLTEQKIYVNGQLYDLVTGNCTGYNWLSGSSFPTPPVVTFGRRNTLNSGAIQTFNGAVDDFLVYNRVLTPTEIQGIYNPTTVVNPVIPTSGLVARYGFDGSGNDLSGNNRNVTTNNVTYVTDRNGTPNSAIKFSGSTGSYAEITGANVASFQNNQYSFGGWVRVDAMTTNSFGTVFQVAGGSAEQIVGPVNTTTPQSFAAWTYSTPTSCMPSVNAYTRSFTFTTGTWYHVFVTNSLTEQKIYVNGQLYTTVSGNCTGYNWANGTSFPTVIEFGRRNTSGSGAIQTFNGAVDDFLVYNRVLTPTEIQSITQSGTTQSTDTSWSFYKNGYIIYNIDGSVNRYHAKLQFSGTNQNIVTDLLWDQLSCTGRSATKVWWINEDHSGNQDYYGFNTTRPDSITHDFGGDFTYHCGCTTTNPNYWSAYGDSAWAFTNIIEVPYHIKKFDVDPANYLEKPSTFQWNKNSLEVQTFKGGLIPPIGAGTIEQYGKINLHTGMLPKSITDYNTVMSYGLSYLNEKNMSNLPPSKRYVTAPDQEWATENWRNCSETIPYPQVSCIGGYQFNHMTTQQAWETFGASLTNKKDYGVVLQDGEFWKGTVETQGLTNYKYCFDQVIQTGSTTKFGQHHAQPYYTNRFFNDPDGGIDVNRWNAKYDVSAANRYTLVNFNYISAYWLKVLANNTSVADDWKISSLQTYTQTLNPKNMYAWIQDLEINKKLFPEWKHLITVEGFHETPYFATVSHTIPTGGAITFTGGQGQWVKHSSSLQEFTGLYSNTVGDGLCYFSDNLTRNDDKSNWVKLDGTNQYPGTDIYARQFYGVDDYLYLGIWKANEVNRQTVGQTWSKPDISVDGGSTWITAAGLLPASAFAAKRPLVHIINTTKGGKIIMAYNMWNPPYKVQTIKVRDANGVINDVRIKGQFPTIYKYGESNTPFLSLSSATWPAPATGGNTTVTISSNVAWSITNIPSWLTISPSSGSNTAVLTITASANTATTRTATITISGSGVSAQTFIVTQAAGTSGCGSTPQNYCWTSPIPAGQIIFRTAAVEVVAGPQSGNDSGNPPRSGNCWCIQQYVGLPDCYIYPITTKDMLLPVASTPTAMQYRVTIGSGQSGKTAKLYVNGELKWSKTVTDQEQVYPDFTGITAQSRVYFVIESNSGRIAAENTGRPEEKLATVIYPNPVDGLVKVVYYLDVAEGVNFSLTNSEGKLLQTYYANGSKGRNQLEMDLKANPAGAYFLRVHSSKKNEILKIIKGN